MSFTNDKDSDNYATDKAGWEIIKPYIPIDKIIWSPFYCDGKQKEYFEEMGYNIIHQDKDFFSYIPKALFEMREKLRIGLEECNIESRPLWKPMHEQPIFQKYTSFTNGVSNALFEKGLCLPSGSNLSELDLQRVVNKISEIVTQ